MKIHGLSHVRNNVIKRGSPTGLRNGRTSANRWIELSAEEMGITSALDLYGVDSEDQANLALLDLQMPDGTGITLE